jgi:hypothetical protein
VPCGGNGRSWPWPGNGTPRDGAAVRDGRVLDIGHRRFQPFEDRRVVLSQQQERFPEIPAEMSRPFVNGYSRTSVAMRVDGEVPARLSQVEEPDVVVAVLRGEAPGPIAGFDREKDDDLLGAGDGIQFLPGRGESSPDRPASSFLRAAGQGRSRGRRRCPGPAAPPRGATPGGVRHLRRVVQTSSSGSPGAQRHSPSDRSIVNSGASVDSSSP